MQRKKNEYRSKIFFYETLKKYKKESELFINYYENNKGKY